MVVTLAVAALAAVGVGLVPALPAQADGSTVAVVQPAAAVAGPEWADLAALAPRQVELDPAVGELAERYAPVVRIREQLEPCGDGEPYEPIDVEVLMGDPGVALRGPWSTDDLVDVGPSSDQIGEGLLDYHLDFPGDALSPGCDFEIWARTISEGTDPKTYARVVSDPQRPGKLALQYWFFYVYNDFNNLHEGDWEMIQLNFDADNVEDALDTEPTEVGYSQHSSAEGAPWGSEKMEIVDDTHPVVYVADGSHANFFSDELYLGASEATGVGCDDTTGPHEDLHPDVAAAPTSTGDYLAAYPWLGFEGRWGERQEAFYNGPTGPNMKTQWTAPIRWSEDSWRDDSAAIPLGSTLTPRATDFFCGAVAAGSNVLRELVRNPLPVAVGLVLLVILAAAVAGRTRWSPAEPYPVAAPRASGQILASARRMYARHWTLFIGIGLVYVPVMVLAAGLQWLLVEVGHLGALTDADGDQNAWTVFLVVLVGGTVSLLSYFSVLAAVSVAMTNLDAGRTVTAVSAYREVFRRLSALVLVGGRLVVTVWALLIFIVTAPLALVYAVRNGFAVQAVMMDDASVPSAFRRSRDLVRGRWWRVGFLAAMVVGLGAIAGPLLGVALLFASDASFDLINLASALVYVFAIPYVALVLGYLYTDLKARREGEAPAEPDHPGEGAPAVGPVNGR